ncbi:MAG: L,D-transpeptidase [Pseudomonadota bacterium]
MKNEMISRRRLLELGLVSTAGAMLAGCTTPTTAPAPRVVPTPSPAPLSNINWAQAYSGRNDAGYALPAIPFDKVPERFRRQEVRNTTGEGAGKLIVQTGDHFLYYTLPRGRAMRYGVGLGREGFEWSGRGEVKRKAEWPRWHPPAEMIDREPELEEFRTTYNAATDTWEGGMDPGLTNPLGARALYIYQDGVDTLYRLHGSPEWWSIGKSVSSGCVRLMNQDIIDLHSRVPSGTEIIVR